MLEGRGTSKIVGWSLNNNGDEMFLVRALLEPSRGGSGTINIEALLDHDYFPPVVAGTMSQ